MSASIREAAIEDVLLMRQAVMYPGESLDFVKLEEDANGIHLGMYVEEELVSVISLFVTGDQLQFRKFATAITQQGRGYGTQLLQHVMYWAENNGMKRIWCNARATATGMYEKMGMRISGNGWKKFGLDFVMMEKYFD